MVLCQVIITSGSLIFHAVDPALIFKFHTPFLHLLLVHNQRVGISCKRTSLFSSLFRVANSIVIVTGQGSPSQEEWEERILHLSMDVLSETVLGIRLSGHSFIQWRFEVLKEEK